MSFGYWWLDGCPHCGHLACGIGSHCTQCGKKMKQDKK